MPRPLIILSQSDSLTQIADINSDTKKQTADSDQKPTDMDQHCLQRQGISGLSRTTVKWVQSTELLLTVLRRWFWCGLFF